MTHVKHITDPSEINRDGLYFISRHGGYFRPNAEGYTKSPEKAGIYSGAEVLKYADVEDISFIDIRSLYKESLEKWKVMKNDLSNLLDFISYLLVETNVEDELNKQSSLGQCTLDQVWNKYFSGHEE